MLAVCVKACCELAVCKRLAVCKCLLCLMLAMCESLLCVKASLCKRLLCVKASVCKHLLCVKAFFGHAFQERFVETVSNLKEACHFHELCLCCQCLT